MENDLFTNSSYQISKLITKRYSTSFSLAIRLLEKDLRTHIYNIYGLVRVADELVDTLQPAESAAILQDLINDTTRAIETGVSLNPVVHAYAQTARRFGFPTELMHAFFTSMEMDLSKKTFSQKDYEVYIFGSAEVVGLMCLMVFVDGDKKKYERLKPGAQALGSAFQKVNFLRDISADHAELGRMYFPDINFTKLNNAQKIALETDVAKDFAMANDFVKKLPLPSRYGVLLAYKYYRELLRKISRCNMAHLKANRIRVSNAKKVLLLISVTNQKLLHR